MNRRRFLLGSVLATFTPPAIVRASSLMPVRVRELPDWRDGPSWNEAMNEEWLGRHTYSDARCFQYVPMLDCHVSCGDEGDPVMAMRCDHESPVIVFENDSRWILNLRENRWTEVKA